MRTFLCKEGWPDSGYRMVLPTQPADDPSALLVGYGEHTATTKTGRLQLHPSDEWQQIQIAAEGRQITMLLNGVLAGVSEIARYGGRVLFDNRKGVVQLRNINIASTERASELPPHVYSASQLKEVAENSRTSSAK